MRNGKAIILSYRCFYNNVDTPRLMFQINAIKTTLKLVTIVQARVGDFHKQHGLGSAILILIEFDVGVELQVTVFARLFEVIPEEGLEECDGWRHDEGEKG